MQGSPPVTVLYSLPFQSANVGGNPQYTRGWAVLFNNTGTSAADVEVSGSCVPLTGETTVVVN